VSAACRYIATGASELGAAGTFGLYDLELYGSYEPYGGAYERGVGAYPGAAVRAKTGARGAGGIVGLA
jgi:hypothetical protein